MADKHTDKKIALLVVCIILLIVAFGFTCWYTITNRSTLAPGIILGMIGTMIVELGLLVACALKAMDLDMKRDP